MQQFLNFIDGGFVPAASGKFLRQSGAYEASAYEIADSSLLDIVRAVQAAHKAESEWASRSTADRALILSQVARLIEADSDALALAQARDQGSLARVVRELSVPVAVEAFRAAASAITENSIFSEARTRGVAAIITPWVDPLAVITVRVAPALAAGACVILKPSRHTPRVAQALVSLLHRAGVPAGVVACLNGSGDEVGEFLVQHPAIKTVSFTGSTSVGTKVAKLAAETLKPCQLALGSHNFAIVLKDADLDSTAQHLSKLVLGYFPAAQLRVSRILAQETIADELLAKMRVEIEAAAMGDPIELTTSLGPLAHRGLVERFHQAKALAQREHAKELLSTPRELPMATSGLFVAPSIAVNLTNCSTILQTEVHGPFATVATFKYQHEALKHANTSPFSRAAFIFSADAERVAKIAQQLQVSQVFVNSAPPVSRLVDAFQTAKLSGPGEFGLMPSLHFFSFRSSLVGEIKT